MCLPVYNESIITFLRRICHRYDAIADRVSEMPESTDELVEVVAFLKKSQQETVHELKADTNVAAERLEFLLDFATLPCEYS